MDTPRTLLRRFSSGRLLVDVNEKVTVVVEPSRGPTVAPDKVESALSDGTIPHVRRGAEKPLDDEDVQQILLILDMRTPYWKSGVSEWSTKVRAKTTTFVLLPSSTSSPEGLLMCEAALQDLSCVYTMFGRRADRPNYSADGADIDGRVRFVRVDDYMEMGDAIILGMMKSGAQFYPMEEQSSMLQLFDTDRKLKEERPARKNEEENDPFEHVLLPIMQKGVGMPRLSTDQKSSLGWHAIVPMHERSTVFLAFNAISQAKHTAAFASKLLLLDQFYTGEMPIEMGGMIVDSVMTVNGSEDYKTDFVGGLLKESEKQTVLLVEASDLVGKENASGEGARGVFTNFLRYYRKERYHDQCTIVFTAETISSLTANPWLLPALYEAIENSDAIFFATYDELPQVHTLFSADSPKYADEDVGLALCMQGLAPYKHSGRFSEHILDKMSLEDSRAFRSHIMKMKLYTFKGALGKVIQEGEIIAPAFTLGKNGSGVDQSKFNVADPRLFLHDVQSEAKIERKLPASESVNKDGGVTVITPAKVLSGILKAVVLSVEAPTWGGAFGTQFKEIGPDEELQAANKSLQETASAYEMLVGSASDGGKTSLVSKLSGCLRISSRMP